MDNKINLKIGDCWFFECFLERGFSEFTIVVIMYYHIITTIYTKDCKLKYDGLLCGFKSYSLERR